MRRLERVIKISTIDNGYMLEFHEMNDGKEQHHVRSYKDLNDLEKELAEMTTEIVMAASNVVRLN